MGKNRNKRTKRDILQSIAVILLCVAMLGTSTRLGDGMEYGYDLQLQDTAFADSQSEDMENRENGIELTNDNSQQYPYGNPTHEEMVEMAIAAGAHVENTPVENKSFEDFSKDVMALCQNEDDDMFSEIVIEAGKNGYKKDGEMLDSDTAEAILVIDDEYLVPESVCRDIFSKDEACTARTDEYLVTEEDKEKLAEKADTEEEQAAVEELKKSDEAYVHIMDMALENTYEFEFGEDKLILTSPYQTARIIVKADQAVADNNAVQVVKGYNDLYILQYETAQEARAACAQLDGMEGVEYVEPDRCMRTMDIEPTQETTLEVAAEGTAKKEYLSWGADEIGVADFENRVVSEGAVLSDVVVAVIDTGIDSDHEMFVNRITDKGYNFIADEKDGAAAPEDDHGHGTHVSGIITDMTEDNVKILPVKVLNEFGSGTELQVYLGIQAAVREKADVINMSIGSAGTSQLFEESINEAVSQGSVVVVAAGNDEDDANNYTPANVKSAITVAATYRGGFVCYYFSNYGSVIDFAAPGENIISAAKGGGTTSMSGTSMASPCVAGIAAWIKSVNKQADAEFASEVIAQNAIDRGLSGFDEEYGYGCVDMHEMEIHNVITAQPEFSKVSGDYTEAFDVTINCQEEGAEIYYTLDGTVPTKENGILFRTGDSIAVTGAVRIMAAAYKDGQYRSPVAEAFYTINGEDVPGAYVVKHGVLVKYNGILENVVIPDEVDGEKITELGYEVFADNQWIRNVVLNDSLEIIGKRAFWQSHLQSVRGNCSIREIEDGAFQYCEDLEKIYVSLNYVRKIGQYAFYNDRNLNSKIELGSLEELDECAFYNCFSLEEVVIGENYKGGEGGEFASCKRLEKVSAKGLEKIGSGMFRNCYNLKTLDINDSKVKEIGNDVFLHCYNLERYFDFSNLEKIGYDVFHLCMELKGVTLSDNIEVLQSRPYGMFSWCFKLEYVRCSGVTEIGKGAFGDVGIFSDKPLILELPWDNITTVGECAFTRVRITRISLPSLRELGEWAFEGCCYLQYVDMPVLEELPEYAFYACNALKVIKIKNVTRIGRECFSKSNYEGLNTIFVQYGLGYRVDLTEITSEQLHIYVTDKLQEIDSDNFNLNDNRHTFDFNTFLHADTGTYAWQYAKDHGMNRIEDLYVELKEEQYPYTGQEVKPEVVVAWDDTKEEMLQEGTDYEIIADAILPGEATAVVSGAGMYFGSVKINYRILPGEITGVAVEPYTGTYDMLVHKAVEVSGSPSGTVTEYSYSQNQGQSWSEWEEECPLLHDAGELLVKVRITGEGFESFVSDVVKAKIGKKNLEEENVTVTVSENGMIYTGKALKPDVEVVWHKEDGTDVLLEMDKDYKLVYCNNIYAGTASVIVLASNGNYKGFWIEDFMITKAINAWQEELNISGWNYGETAKEPKAESKFGKAVYTYSNAVDGVYTSEVPAKAGTWYVRAEVEETDDYTGLSQVKEFTIGQRDCTIYVNDVKVVKNQTPLLKYSAAVGDGGLLPGDALSGVVMQVKDSKGAVVTDYSQPGVYTITVSDYKLENADCYNVTVREGTLTILAQCREHSMGEWHVTREATCSEKGEKRRECSICDYYETEEITVKEHHYNVKINKLPTYTEKGMITYSCDSCGASYTEVLDKLTMPQASEEPQPSESMKPSEEPQPSESVEASETPKPSGTPVEVILGDVDNDKIVSLNDAQILLKAALKMINLTEDMEAAADVNHDEKVTLEDAQLVLKAALHIIDLQMIQKQ